MKIIISSDFAREILATCAKGVSKDESRPAMMNFLLACFDGKVDAVCSDGSSMRRITAKALEGSEDCEMLTPVFAKPGKDVESLMIEKQERKIIITERLFYEQGENRKAFQTPDGDFLKYREILAKPDVEPQGVVYVNPKILSEILADMMEKSDGKTICPYQPVRLEVYGIHEAIRMTADNGLYDKSAIMLPLYVKQE